MIRAGLAAAGVGLALIAASAGSEPACRVNGSTSTDAPTGTRLECRSEEREDGLEIAIYRDLDSGRLLRQVISSGEAARACHSGVPKETEWRADPECYLGDTCEVSGALAPGLMLADEFLVGFREPLTDDDLRAFDRVLSELSRPDGESYLRTMGVSSVWRSGSSRDRRIAVLRFDGATQETYLEALDEVPRVVLADLFESTELISAKLTFVEPNFLLEGTRAVPGSPRSGSPSPGETSDLPWGLVATRVPCGWACLDRGTKPTVEISLLDSGVYSCHEELLGALAECPDATFRQTEFLGMSDLGGHGTQCAGVIAAQPGSIPTIGVAPDARLVPIKILDRHARGEVIDAVNALQALAHREHEDRFLIVNASWGLAPRSESLKLAVSGLLDSGALLIAGAGNYGDDIRKCPFYPASFSSEDGLGRAMVTVGAVDLKMQRARLALVRWGDDCEPHRNPSACSGSNYGGDAVTLGAPGEDIETLGIKHPLSVAEGAGTSMATAFVAGAAALVKGHFPDAGAEELATRLKNGACQARHLGDFWEKGRFLDLEGALAPTAALQSSSHRCDPPLCTGKYCAKRRLKCRMDCKSTPDSPSEADEPSLETPPRVQ